MSEPAPAIAVHQLHKTYRLGKVALHVLRGVSFSVPRGRFASIVGASGSGKSTLLHLIGLLDRPDRGQIMLEGQDASTFSHGRRNGFRCRGVGFVFQFYHLMAELDVLQNVLLPARVEYSWLSWYAHRGQARRRAMEILDRLGLGDRLKHRPKELSGGERQRVAIARALVNHPGILLADEPTGNLDSHTGLAIMDVLRQCNRQAGQTIVMVTHDLSLAEQTDNVLMLRDGKLRQ